MGSEICENVQKCNLFGETDDSFFVRTLDHDLSRDKPLLMAVNVEQIVFGEVILHQMVPFCMFLMAAWRPFTQTQGRGFEIRPILL